MDKIVIIGSSGAGKSTFARKLGPIHQMKVFHLDRLFWKRDWEEKSGYERIEILEKSVLEEKRWIIEGNYLRFAELHVNAADTIIFLDMSPLLCFWRNIKRHLTYRGRSRRDIPEGCTDKLSLLRMLKVLTFPLAGRRTIELILRNYQSKQIIRLHSVKEVNEFLTQLEQLAKERRLLQPA